MHKGSTSRSAPSSGGGVFDKISDMIPTIPENASDNEDHDSDDWSDWRSSWNNY